jgi:hypothetical protein
MSFAAEAADRIRKSREDIATSQQAANRRREIAINNAVSLLEDLFAALEKHTEDFVNELPEAKESGLGTLRIGQHQFKITTKSCPLLIFDLNFDRPVLRIRWTLSERISSMAPHRTLQGMIGLAVDRDLQPCFTDGEKLVAPSVLAEELMGLVFDLFDRANRVRSLLA